MSKNLVQQLPFWLTCTYRGNSSVSWAWVLVVGNSLWGLRCELEIYQCKSGVWGAALAHLFTQVTCSSWFSPARSQMYHLYFAMDCCWAHLTLWLFGSDRTQLMTVCSGCSVTSYPMIRCSVSIRAPWYIISWFSKSKCCSAFDDMALLQNSICTVTVLLDLSEMLHSIFLNCSIL